STTLCCPYSLLFSVSSLAGSSDPRVLHAFPTRRSSDLQRQWGSRGRQGAQGLVQYRRQLPTGQRKQQPQQGPDGQRTAHRAPHRSEEHTSELQSRFELVCRLLLEKKKNVRPDVKNRSSL